jgi:3'-phosphoadenosine 5'-phosphosulfate sulfotransferase (PAPS reductase)/FAD synthetase
VKDPFFIEGPAVISFSGGRTSGLMLRKILDVGLQPDVHVLFANTGKERPETLDFVEDCERNWRVPIVWMERATEIVTVKKTGKQRIAARVRVVSRATASREGEPFAALIKQRNFLPNPVKRYCTSELKIRVMKRWMIEKGYRRWLNVVGLRADEPRRVAKQRAGLAKKPERWTIAHPLHAAGITKEDVAAFWSAQPFDLQLRQWEGNCDLCFLKGISRKLRVIRDRPDLIGWWQEQEQELRGVSKISAARFRNDQPSYSKMLQIVQSTPLLPGVEDVPDLVADDSIDCFCTN